MGLRSEHYNRKYFTCFWATLVYNDNDSGDDIGVQLVLYNDNDKGDDVFCIVVLALR